MSKLSLNVQIAFRQRHTFLALALVFLVLLIAGIVLVHHNIVLLLLLSVLFALIAGSAAVLLARPLAISFYIRSVQAEQRQNSRLYVPLSAMKNMYQTPVHYRDVAKDQRQDVTTLIRQSLTNILFLGLPGAGKTVTLRAYQFAALRDRWRLLFGNKPIPLYVSMREYNVALHEKGILAPLSSTQRSFSPSTPTEMLTTIRTLLTYLLQRSDQAGITYLQPYLEQLIEEGRLLFLCDGLNEVDTDWLGFVSWELMFLMRHTQNKVVMTCRELDYRDRDELRMLVEKNFAAEALILPLTLQQMKLFVTQYIAYSKDEDKDWLYTPEQINDAIEHSNLSYNCNNPMMLLTVMHTMNELGPAQTISLNTRGKLLNSFVLQLIHREQARPQWTMPIQDEQIMRFLSYVACIGRRAGFRISIPLDKINAPGTGNLRRALPVGEQAALLQTWLDTTIHQLQAHSRLPGSPVEYQPQLSLGDIEYLLDFAQSAALITISHSNILSFRHELIEEYFVAEYLRYLDTLPQGLPFVGELVQSIGPWSEPAAIWAGMLPDPMDLARKFAAIGASYSQSNPGYAYNALALSFICAGTTWTSPKSPVETGRQQPQLPGAVRTLLESFVPDQDKCRDLAGIIKRSAKEGGGEVYRSLLPLLIDGNMIDLMLLLDREEVLAFLFNNLHDTVAMGMVDQTANLVKTLGSFGDDTVNYAAWLLSEPGLTSDLHATILDILGRTASQRAVRLLCNRLEIEEERIQKAVVNALVVLGPALVLEAIVDELKQHVPIALIPIRHWNALQVLQGFLAEQRHQLNETQFSAMIDALLQTLAYRDAEIPAEAYSAVRHKAASVLREQARPDPGKSHVRWEIVITAMIRSLLTEDEEKAAFLRHALQQIGTAATPFLQEGLRNSRLELARTRIIDIIGAIGDENALPDLIPWLGGPSPNVQQHAADALFSFAPRSIEPLIQAVLNEGHSVSIALNASRVLVRIGSNAVPSIIQALRPIVRQRTVLLMDALVQIHDFRAVNPMVAMLKSVPQEQGLAQEVVSEMTLGLIRALGTFDSSLVVPQLIETLLRSPRPFNQEASSALSGLGAVAIDGLVGALVFPDHTTAEQRKLLFERIAATLLKMNPFPSEELLSKFATISDQQADYLVAIFRQKGDTAAFLVNSLGHANPRVQEYTTRMLDQLTWAQLREPLLEALRNPNQLEQYQSFLLKFQESIPELVQLLDNNERRNAAARVLFAFGTHVIPRLAPGTPAGLESVVAEARYAARDILVRLVRQEQAEEQQKRVAGVIVDLFGRLTEPDWNQPNLPYAWAEVINLLTNQLADVSIEPLIVALGDGKKQTGAVKTLVKLVKLRNAQSERAKDQLLKALHRRDRRDGAQLALIELGAEAVEPVSKRVLEKDLEVRQAAQHILSSIGAAALPFIWATYRDNDPHVREASSIIFNNMKTHEIKDTLVHLLTSNNSHDVEMAMTLLTERISNETQQQREEMISLLFEYIQHHAQEASNLRVIGLLLMQRKDLLLNYLIEHIKQKGHQEWLPYLLLFLGLEGPHAQARLEEILENRGLAFQVRAEAAAVLGLLRQDVSHYASKLRRYGRATIQLTDSGVLELTDRDVALRALGGMLASGKWTSSDLVKLSNLSTPGSEEHDLYSVLLGAPFGLRIENMSKLLDEHRKKITNQSNTINQLNMEIESLKQNNKAMKRTIDTQKTQLQQYQQPPGN